PPLAGGTLSAPVLGFDPAEPATRPGRLPLLFQAVENILHVASRPMNGADSIDNPARPEPRLCVSLATAKIRGGGRRNGRERIVRERRGDAAPADGRRGGRAIGPRDLQRPGDEEIHRRSNRNGVRGA